VFMAGPGQDRLTRLSLLLLGAFYVGYLIPHWMILFRLPDGRAWVFFVLFVVMVGDSAAYLVGRRYGRRKLAPELSPGKTVEGAVGYFAGTVIAGLISTSFLPAQIHASEVLLLSLVFGALGQIGDLFESLMKRVFAVKDSGALLPGHGGLLDRLDSLVFPVVFTAVYLKVFHA
jgi:phosphatidate cytidylyltransferase